jgi:2-C-methyl-D-erythritol 4-phosphate cytidylyltransferase
MRIFMGRIVGVVLAGGVGKRFGSVTPKQLLSLNGKPVMQFPIDALRNSHLIDYIIIVSNKESIPEVNKKITGFDLLVAGGKNRFGSISEGICACPPDTEKVIFLDANRPLINSEDIKLYVDALKKYKMVVTYQPITDALEGGDREHFKLIQTPEAFDYEFLRKHFHEVARAISIQEHIYEETPSPIGYVKLNHPNIKATFPEDLFYLEMLMKYYPLMKRTPQLKGKKILLFGVKGGIGKEIWKLLVHEGADVTGLGREEIDLAHNFIWANGNRWFDIHDRFDCIILCAATYARDDEGLLAKYDTIMDTNVKAAVYLLENAPKLLKKGGNIVLVGSTAGQYGRKGISVYSASKAALNSLVESLSEPYLTKYGIKINCICPAKVGTKLQTHINPKADLTKMLSPKVVAKIILGYCDVDFTGNIVYIKEGFNYDET